MGVVYVGTQAHTVLVVERGEPTGEALPHVVRHSPTGFSWGYEGSGPSELARCLLLHALGDAAVCPVCRGTYVLDYQDEPTSPEHHKASCWACDGGYLLKPGVYQDFKRQVIGQLATDAEWRLPQVLVLSWLLAYAESHLDVDALLAREGALTAVLMDVPEELHAG